MEDIRSSYNHSITFKELFQSICFLKQPKKILEFGILDGYSLLAMTEIVPPTTSVTAYDIFDDFNGNHANETEINEMFKNYENVQIKKGNFWYSNVFIKWREYDIIHIDIANDGSVYNFAFETITPQMNPNCVLLLEGGSKERDQVEWMTKYHKTPIQSVIKKFKNKFKIYTINSFPSLTIVRT